jgi:hypothetical protein
VSEGISDVRSFLADICESRPFLGGRVVLWLGWFGVMEFMGFEGEGVVP